MLHAKQKLTGEIVTAYFANKSQAPFSCPECGDPVILKSGKSRVNYFAHENPLACKFAGGESEAHENCKMQIFAALKQHPAVSNAALEHPIGTNRPDVSAEINGVQVAIEVQLSPLSIETIMQRTIDYYRAGIHVLWLLQWTADMGCHRPPLARHSKTQASVVKFHCNGNGPLISIADKRGFSIICPGFQAYGGRPHRRCVSRYHAK